MKSKFISLCIILLSFTVTAQNIEKQQQVTWGFYISSGVKFINFDNLNSFFSDNNVSSLENYGSNNNYGFYFKNTNNGTYTEIHYSTFNTNEKKEQSNVKPEFKGRGYGFSFNYDLLKKKPTTILYPKIGLDINQFELNLINKSYNQTDFNQIINNLSGEKTLKTNNIYSIDIGAGFEQRINFSFVFIYLGINTSYSFNFNNEKWLDLQKNTTYNFPKTKTNGLKIMLNARIEINWSKLKLK